MSMFNIIIVLQFCLIEKPFNKANNKNNKNNNKNNILLIYSFFDIVELCLYK